MAEINEYNPVVGIRLKDLQLLLAISQEDDFGFWSCDNMFECVAKSVDGNATYTFGSKVNQMLYDRIMEVTRPSVEKYDKYLLSLGYTMEDIDAYHQKKYDGNDEAIDDTKKE